MDDYISKGFKDLPGDKTVTDKLCQWNKPARRIVEPKTIHDIRLVKQEHGKIPKQRKTLAATEFDPRNPADRARNPDNFTVLVEILQTANPTCGFVKFNTEARTDVPASAPDETQDLTQNQELILPPSLSDLRTACDNLKDSLKMTQKEMQELERQTVDQSESKLWHSSRESRLTASLFHSIIFRRDKTDPKNLLKNMLYNRRKPTAAMSFGLAQEDASAERFKEEMKKHHSNVKLSKRGFIVDSERAYIGTSVDRVGTISGDRFIVELKNPLSTLELDIKSAAHKLACLKIDENNKVSLNQRNAY